MTTSPPPSDLYLACIYIAWVLLICALSLDAWRTVHFFCLPLTAWIAWRVAGTTSYWYALKEHFWALMFPPEDVPDAHFKREWYH